MRKHRRFPDKVVVILAGQPKHVSSATWRRLFVKNFIELSKKQMDLHEDSSLHIICSTWSYDSTDRYLNSDWSSSGMKIKQNVLDNLWTEIGPRDETGHYVFVEDGNIDKNKGKIKLKEDKFKKYMLDCFDFADSCNFLFMDPYELKKNAKGRYVPPMWRGQYILFSEAIKKYYKELELTDNSVIIRLRYDVIIANKIENEKVSLIEWKPPECNLSMDLCKFLQPWWHNNSTERVYYTSETDGHTNSGGITTQPTVMFNDIRISYGRFVGVDYFHIFNLAGALKFSEEWFDWYLNLESDLDRNMVTPEAIIWKYFYDHNFSITTQYNTIGYQALYVKVINWTTHFTDEWRLEWYDWPEKFIDKHNEI